MKSEYRIVARSCSSIFYGETLYEFVQEINRLASNEWKIIDGANIFFAQNSFYFYQTLIKEIEE